jgi:hypothetical protein
MVASLLILFTVPLFNETVVDTRIVENSKIDLGFPVIANKTQDGFSIYQWFYKMIYKTTTMEKKQ